MDGWRKKLKEYRENARLSQSALAKQSGVSVSMISLIESGQRGGRKDIIEKLAKVLGCTYADIFSDLEPSLPSTITSPPGEKPTDINIQQLLNMTAEILVSDTMYRNTMADTIRAFRRAVDLEKTSKDVNI